MLHASLLLFSVAKGVLVFLVCIIMYRCIMPRQYIFSLFTLRILILKCVWILSFFFGRCFTLIIIRYFEILSDVLPKIWRKRYTGAGFVNNDVEFRYSILKPSSSDNFLKVRSVLELFSFLFCRKIKYCCKNTYE